MKSVAISAALLLVATNAHADPRPVSGFSMQGSAGWFHTSVFGVSMNAAEIAAGIGYTYQEPHGFGVDVHGTLGIKAGATEARRSLTGFDPIGLAFYVHYDWLRIGLGARAGSLAVRRSTKDESQAGPLGDLYAGVGIEPLAIAGRPLFVEGRAHRMVWDGQPMTAFTVMLGVRLCGERCAP